MAITPILTDADVTRNRIRSKALLSLTQLFPIESKSKKIRVEDIQVKNQTYSLAQAKVATLAGKSLTEPVYGTVILEDAYGKVIEKSSKYKLLDLPYYTDDHTFIIDGSSYSVGNQLRTKSGIYTRVRGNEVLESSFNLAKGTNFRITMDPETSIFHIEYGTTKIPLWPVLSILGINPTNLNNSWGKDIAAINIGFGDSKKEQAITKLYEKLIPERFKNREDGLIEKIRSIQNYFNGTEIDPTTTKKTLGVEINSVTGNSMLLAATKLLKVFKQEENVDDRDSLEFQKINSIDDFIQERLDKGSRELVNKLKYKMDNIKDITSVREVMPPGTFSPSLKSLLTQFDLSRTPDQINPIEILDSASKITRLGEGGISSIRAVPEATRNLHPTHVGIIDPVRTPESHKTGIDTRATLTAARDEEGNLYSQLINLRTKKLEYVPVEKMSTSSIAFANQKLTGEIDVLKDGKVTKVNYKDADYMVPTEKHLLSPSTSLLPFMDSMQGNRALMGSKMMTQALPLKYREAPLVQVTSFNKGESVQKEMGSRIVKTSPVKGVVESIDSEYIRIKDGKGKIHNVGYNNYFPYNSKTYINDYIKVKEGDTVSEGQDLTDTNYTQNGVLALGKNMKVAYLPYLGKTENDAIVISDKASKDLTSLHLYKKILELDSDVTVDRNKWITQFPNKYNAQMLSNIESNGVIKSGSIVNYGDPLILGLAKAVPNATDLMLGNLSNRLKRTYKDVTVVWDHEFPGKVKDVLITGSRAIVTVKMEAPVQEGDKLAGSYGNKGVVSQILPADQMPKTLDGEPVDILLTSAGVSSRINPAQILETALGKVAKKRGEPILVTNFTDHDNVQWVKDELAKEGISDKETLLDPMTGRKIPNVMVGYQNIMKLFKSTDTNFAARGIGSYDTNQQPTKGGIEGAKRLGNMEMNALYAHGAKNLVHEAMNLKGQRNDEWWNSYRLNLPLPKVRNNFATDKFNAMLAGAGIKVNKDREGVYLGALTDKDIKELSNGTITEAHVLRKKDLRPEVNGLFDPYLTGGLEGNKWADIKFNEPNLKPAFTKPAAQLLDVSTSNLEELFFNYGGKYLQKKLDSIDLVQEKDSLMEKIKQARGAELDKIVKKLKIINTLLAAKMKPSEAYMGNYLAVLPPSMRPVIPGPNDQLLVADSNHLYRDVILSNNKLNEAKKILPEEELIPLRKEIFKSVKALSGLGEPSSRKLLEQGKKGFLKQITGPTPSEGYFQEKILGRPQDLSGRGTAGVDPNLKINEIGLPEEMAWGIYSPFVTRRLVKQGYNALTSQKLIEEKHPVAQGALYTEVKERPVILNRAPTLWRHNVVSAYPKLIPGKTIRVNPFVEQGMNLDFDGDALQIHVPVTPKAVEEAKAITQDKQLFSDKTRNDLLVFPQHEAIFGLAAGTKPNEKGEVRRFANKDEAMKAYFNNEINMNDKVIIGKH